MPLVFRNGKLLFVGGRLAMDLGCCCTEEERNRRCVQADVTVTISYGTSTQSVASVITSESAVNSHVRSVNDSFVSFNPAPAGLATATQTGPGSTNVATSAACRRGGELVEITRSTGQIVFHAVVSNLGTLSVSFHPGLGIHFNSTVQPLVAVATYVTSASMSVAVVANDCSVDVVGGNNQTWNPRFSVSTCTYANDAWNLQLNVTRP